MTWLKDSNTHCNTSKTEELAINNCPFCKSDEPEGDWLLKTNGVIEEAYVKCSNCETDGPTGKSEKEAIEFWNTPGDKLRSMENAYLEADARIKELEKEVRMLKGMVDNGLGPEDLVQDY